ncbi:hypothetical protein GN958_ATG20466, partial [Phytophthora infestans]
RSFVKIFELFRPHAPPHLLDGRDHSFERKMGLLLLALALSGSMKDAGLALGISQHHTAATINELLRFICMHAEDFIKMPSTSAGWREIMGGFPDVRGISYVCGAVDGSSFEISRPAERLLFCDHRRRLWNMICGRAQNTISRGRHLLGDAGLTLSCELLTSYIPREEGGKLSRIQERYNYIHSATRMAIESKIRRLLEQKSIMNCTRIILSAMTLHNILIDLNDNTISRNTGSVLEMEPDFDLRAISRAQRDELARLLYC